MAEGINNKHNFNYYNGYGNFITILANGTTKLCDTAYSGDKDHYNQ